MSEYRNMSIVGICPEEITKSITIGDLKNAIKSLESQIPNLDDCKVVASFLTDGYHSIKFPLINKVSVDKWNKEDKEFVIVIG